MRSFTSYIESRVDGRLSKIALIILALILSLHLLHLTSNSNIVRVPPYTRSNESVEKPLIPQAQHPSAFPRKIWQTSKTGAADIDDESKRAIRTWQKLNQRWRFEVLTDWSAETYVGETFIGRPDIVELYMNIQDPILRADMLRYLVLLGDGGAYSDMDTKALKPILDWIPMEYQHRANMVVGIEYDKMDGGRWLDWTLDLQFTNWAILAKPGHPLMELTVEKLMENLKKLAYSQGKAVGEIRPSFHEVLDTTGPALFTRAIFEFLSRGSEVPFTWQNVTKLKEPMLVQDVLILPITSFGNSQAHSNSGDPEEDGALVQHMFRGSWKDAHAMRFPDETNTNGVRGEEDIKDARHSNKHAR